MRFTDMLDYDPKPIDTSEITLAESLLLLIEKLAENSHENWARKRLSDGWVYGPKRDDQQKTHPGLVPYCELTEEEKEYDRILALETLKVIVALGYTIEFP